MTTPHIASLTALAASLFFIVFTITQANTQSPDRVSGMSGVCIETFADAGPACPTAGTAAISTVLR